MSDKKAPRSGLSSLALGLVVANLCALGLGWAAIAAGSVPARVLILLIPAILVFLLPLKFRMSWEAAALTAMFTGVLGGFAYYGYVDYRAMVRGERVEQVSVARVPDLPQASAFTFTDAHVATEYQGEDSHCLYPMTRARLCDRRYAAPLVPQGWTPADPVPAWALCVEREWEEKGACLPLDREAPSAVATRYEPGMDLVAGIAEAHGLTIKAQAPVLRVVETPQEAVAQARSQLLWTFCGGNAVFLFMFLLLGPMVSLMGKLKTTK